MLYLYRGISLKAIPLGAKILISDLTNLPVYSIYDYFIHYSYQCKRMQAY